MLELNVEYPNTGPHPLWLILCVVLLVAGSVPVRGVPVGYTNETDFIAAVEAQGYVWVLESFDDDEVWGGVRSTISEGSFSAPSITNFSVRFSANTNSSSITSSEGAAVTGQWGAYSLPHGSYSTGVGCDIPGQCGDGLLISYTQPMYAMSVWVSGSWGGKLEVILDDNTLNPVNFPEACDFEGENCISHEILSPVNKFFGVIDVAGFNQCELREMEGTAEDQKFIWCDDFTIAFSNPPPPRLRNMVKTDQMVVLHFKELAARAPYLLESSSRLVSNSWELVDQFTADSMETNRTSQITNGWDRVYFRLRSP